MKVAKLGFVPRAVSPYPSPRAVCYVVESCVGLIAICASLRCTRSSYAVQLDLTVSEILGTLILLCCYEACIF